MSEHTLAPWKYDELTAKVWDADDMPVCIAAAPELLEELKGMVRVWENGWKVDEDIYIANAKAAIAKACSQ